MLNFQYKMIIHHKMYFSLFRFETKSPQPYVQLNSFFEMLDYLFVGT